METDWILDEIATGLQKLYLLSLDHTPAADLLAGTAQAWHEAITANRSYDEARDAPRFRAAFLRLAQTCTSWPAPRHFLDALPRVEQVAVGYEVKPASREEAEAAMARIRGLLKDVPTFKPEKREPTVPAADKQRIEGELRAHYSGKAAAAGPDR